MKSLVLVGFMGTGKNAVGKRLAAQLGRPLVDTDDLVVRLAGKSITRIFAEDGEEAFRDLETEVLRQLVVLPEERVVSAGGGMVLAERNWPLLRALGKVVCLTAEPEEILKRLGRAEGRPLLAGEPAEVLQRIRAMAASRREAYAKADWTVPTDGQSPEAVAETIARWLENQTDS